MVDNHKGYVTECPTGCEEGGNKPSMQIDIYGKPTIQLIFYKQTTLNTLHSEILSTFKFLDNSQDIPKSISDLFSEVNKLLSTSIIPSSDDTFYSNTGQIDKKSWRLDLSSVNVDKSLTSFLLTKMQINALGGSAGANNIDGFENDQIVCIHEYGNKNGSPVEPISFNYLSCTEK
jgi:hypothetical protein